MLVGLMIAVIVFTAIEVRAWKTGYRFGPARQLYGRIAGAVLSFLILALILLGRYILREADPLMSLAYWVGCLGLAFLLFVLALWDMGQTGMWLSEKRRELMQKTFDEKDPPS